MENFLTTAVTSGNALAIIGSLLVYLIIHVQRRNTATTRESENASLKEEIHNLKVNDELKQKDIAWLLDENRDIKKDIKEMKETLNRMAISLAEIASQLKAYTDND